ncbi:hypothetical protein [Kutzneria sp. 744]|uniref:hypothetical protein n=1 Tax=Kutzneria sp. (strain 744) TaxID=345341 RepID=UPI0003EEDFE0|nr:hypothetical protein [Kutzneria sp. 744]EWM19789.1 hypothetical protein KUTG_10093 [Kutzneria sp. 744]
MIEQVLPASSHPDRIARIFTESRPLECGNVAPTADNIDALGHEHARLADELAARPSLPPLLAHRLRARHGQITHFLDRHRETP